MCCSIPREVSIRWTLFTRSVGMLIMHLVLLVEYLESYDLQTGPLAALPWSSAGKAGNFFLLTALCQKPIARIPVHDWFEPYDQVILHFRKAI